LRGALLAFLKFAEFLKLELGPPAQAYFG